MSGIVRFLIWLGAVAGIVALTHLAGAIFGIDQHAHRDLLRDATYAAAILGLIALVMFDDRPLETYGLVIEEGWRRRLILSYAIGAGAMILYIAFLVAIGLFGPRDEISWTGVLRAPLTFAATLIVGYLQVLLFCGFLLGTLRADVGAAASIIITAVVFGLLQHASRPWIMMTEEWQALVGSSILMALLCLLRLVTGSVLVPGGFLAGMLFINRVNSDADIARFARNLELLPIFAPQRNVFHGAVTWGILGIAILILIIVVLVRGEREPRGGRAIPVSLKRIYPFGVMNSLAPIDVWIGRLRERRGRIEPAYWPRLTAALVVSSINTVLSLPERLIAPLVLRGRAVESPLFIVGVHRSGTTHLQNLLSLDLKFRTARTFAVMNPTGFLTLGWLLVPLVALVQPWRRPMDRMKFNIFTPNEDEFAIANMSKLSPYWGITFPKSWPRYDAYVFPDRMTEPERAQWTRLYMLFARKLMIFSRKRPLLKNPYHTARVAFLRSIFPDARFIHLVRHPFDVYRSNVHLAREGHVLMQVQNQGEDESYLSRFLDNYRAMEEQYSENAAALPAGVAAELRFEDLERDPVGEIRRIYDELELEFAPRFERRVKRYLARTADYQKNPRRELPVETRGQISEALGDLMVAWGYDAGHDARDHPRVSAPPR